MPAIPPEPQSFYGWTDDVLAQLVEVHVLTCAGVKHHTGLRVSHGETIRIQNFRQLSNGRLEFSAQISGKTRISDCYQIEFRIPETFLLPPPSRWIFLERCVIPYLYRYSYLRTHGEAPFGDLEHGASGIREDLRLLLGRKRQSEVLPFVRLLGMRKRHANKERCPCGSGDRVGRRHHRQLNRLRKRLGRYWFRVVEQQLLNDALSGKSSSVRGRLIRWRGNVVSDILSEEFWRIQRRRSGASESPWIRAMRSPDSMPA